MAWMIQICKKKMDKINAFRAQQAIALARCNMLPGYSLLVSEPVGRQGSGQRRTLPYRTACG